MDQRLVLFIRKLLLQCIPKGNALLLVASRVRRDRGHEISRFWENCAHLRCTRAIRVILVNVISLGWLARDLLTAGTRSICPII